MKNHQHSLLLKNPKRKMGLSKSDWYFIPLAIVIIILVSANELGYGVIVFIPLILQRKVAVGKLQNLVYHLV